MPRRKVRYHTESLAEINMTNLIDVTMVLLIIFILVSNFVTSGLNVSVPKISYNPVSGKERIVIGVNNNGNYSLNDRSTAYEEMENLLADLHRQYPEEGIVIHTSENCVYGDVAKVISLAQKVGYPKVNLPMANEPK